MAWLGLVLVACVTSKDSGHGDSGCCGETGTESDADADADADSDSDADGDTDTDTDADADTGVPESGEDTGEGECDEETPIELFLSPDDSNSMASPVVLRSAILDGVGWAGRVRTYEFMNYYDFDYKPPTERELSLDAAMRRDSATEFTLQIGVASRELAKDQRNPMNLVLSLDTSCSMAGDPMDRMRFVGLAIAGELDQGDRVSIVEWNADQDVVLEAHEVTGPDDPVLVGAIEALKSGGGTDLDGGLERAYELAEEHFSAHRINRVVLVSDGNANLGSTSGALIGEKAGAGDEHGIYLVGVGVAEPEEYQDDLLDQVTDLGKGASLFIPHEQEAEKMFAANFVRTFDVAAREVEVELDLPPGFEIQRFSGEQVGTSSKEVEPQHLAPNDTMVFYTTMETCAPELLDADPEVTVTVRWKDATSFEAQSTSRTWTFEEITGEDPALLLKGEAVYLYAEALKTAQGRSGRAGPSEALEALDALEALTPGDGDIQEMRRVLEAL